MADAPSFAVDFPQRLLADAEALYAPDVLWCAPRRGLSWRGRDEVIRRLLAEASGMREPRFTPLRRSVGDRRIIDEYAVRFVYTGAGIEGVRLGSGDTVELERLRILIVDAGRVSNETCIENWTVLGRKPAASPF
jgi:hypothetical protein